MSKPSIKDQLVTISEDYLGPAAERFIDRQIRTHLKKNPENLTASDLYNLIAWLKLSFSILTEDKKLIEEYIGRLDKIRPSSA